jgi:hypothetical protein
MWRRVGEWCVLKPVRFIYVLFPMATMMLFYGVFSFHNLIFYQISIENLFECALFFGLSIFGYFSAIIGYRKHSKEINNNGKG